jgi:hypothetical protein
MRLARRKLAKKTHPNHGGHHCPMATMVPSPRHCPIQQLANMLCNKSMSLKLENIIAFTMHLLNTLRHNALTMLRAQVLLVVSADGAESIILSVGGAENNTLSSRH